MSELPRTGAPAARAAPSRALVLALVALLCAIWGSTWLVIRRGLEDLPPFSGAALRFVLAALVFACIAPPLARLEGGARPSWLLAAVMGLLNIALSYAVIYWTETVLPSGLVSLLWSIFPLLLALLGRLMLPEERLGAREWAGLALGLAGTVLLFSTDLESLGPAAIPAGLVLLLSPLASAVGNLAVKRHGGSASSVLLNQRAMAIAAPVLVLLALALEPVGELRLTPSAIASVLYLALVGTVLAFGIYFWLLRYAAAHVLALISYVVPLIALTLGALVEGEPFGRSTAAGGALVLGGVALTLAGKRARARRAALEARAGAGA